MSEVVYDIDNGLLYTGDNATSGGIPVGSGVGKKPIKHTVTPQEILDKSITLENAPKFPNEVEVEFVGGITQLNGIDFEIQNNLLQWTGLGLDNFIEENDILIIRF